ncbi:hypothetical protein B0H17DRAFT_1067038 [Mycena rosella]|uniref:Uncharacterized protein n=1 Tax=Mycena rosella TaxID=1033263 RepID=A0AAD7GDC0_MYCRO|nr:hypothetical protein B0H17DRAFT_1067038 [Mycena rosella]
MAAITVMLVLALTEIIVQLVLTALSMQSLYSTVQDATDTTLFSQQQASFKRLVNWFGFAEDIILVTNNAIADSLFIYRCYIVWCYNKRVISLPVFLLLITTVLGYITVYRNIIGDPDSHVVDTRVGFAFVLITNLTITGLTAGRIWWTRRQLAIVGQTKITQRYTTAISVLLESGAVYCLILIVVILALSAGRTATAGPTAIPTALSYGAASQLVNIVPTVFIVRVCLVRNPNSEANSKLVPA